MSSNSVSGKRILVTGGTTGIGRETVALLAREGAKIVTFGRDEQALEDSLSNLGEFRSAVHGLAADISTPDGVKKVFAEADLVLGGLDALVSNAALGAEPIHEMADDEWRKVIETNLVGSMACAREAVLRMKDSGGGELVFVGSISTDIKKEGESVYVATKAGIQAFAETLHKEVADLGIKVGVIQPGSISTDMQECSDDEKREAIERGEMLHAAEIAEAILFVLTRSLSADVVNLRIEPVRQKTH